MKKLSNLSGMNVLSKEQLKMIVAGRWSCECSGSTGQWSGNYSSGNDAIDAIEEWCSSGTGTCTQGNETVGIYFT
jgi:hypothetical protein